MFYTEANKKGDRLALQNQLQCVREVNLTAPDSREGIFVYVV